MFSFLRSDHWFIYLTYSFIRKVISPLVRAIWIKKVEGIENIPRNGTAILAFNHQSYLDFICFSSISPRNVHFLSAEKFFDKLLWRIIMIITGQIKVERKSHDKSTVYSSITRHVAKGSLIGIFPEGTRSPHKDEMVKSFTGVAKFSLKHHVPVIPIGIIGTYELLPRHESFPALKKIVEFHVGKPLYFDTYYHLHDDENTCVLVMEKVVKEIEKLSRKVYPHYIYKHE